MLYPITSYLIHDIFILPDFPGQPYIQVFFSAPGLVVLGVLFFYLYRKMILGNGGFLYTRKDAMHFIEECRRNRIEILGIDAFKPGENSTLPPLEESIDYLFKTV